MTTHSIGQAPFTLHCFVFLTRRQQECLRLFHHCVNLVSIAVLVENGALKDFTQECLNLCKLCLNLDCSTLFCCSFQLLACNLPVNLKSCSGKDVFPMNLHNSK